VAAFDDDADAVKGDFRVTKDNMGMVMHSSPIEIWESLNCYHRKVEKMTEAQAKKCKMLPTNETFISAAELLDWAEDKVITMFCVKEATDIPRMGAASDVDTLLSDAFAPLLPRLFTFEFDPSWPDWDMNVTDVIANRLHPAGVRSFAASKKTLPSTQNHLDLYNAGFDVVYTYGTKRAVDARKQVNEARGIDPASVVV